MTELRLPSSLRYNARRPFAGAVLLAALLAVAAGCGDGNGSPDMGPADMGPTGMFTVGECDDVTDCAGGTCLVGFERLGDEEFDGSLFPGATAR